MSVCTFFGHRDCHDTIEKDLRNTLIDLIENCGVDTFLVGNQGAFDALVCRNLQKLQRQYANIHYSVVWAYLPACGREVENWERNIFPAGIEDVPKKYAIDFRNRWMLHQADYVVAYVKYTFGGAAKYVSQAIKMQKAVINLACPDK